MREFSALCKLVEDLDPQTYNEIIAEKSVSIINALAGITEDGMDALTIYTNFILCSIAADGKLDEHEFMLIKPALDIAIGRDVGFEDAKKMFQMAGLDKSKDYKVAVDEMVDVLGIVSPELKEDIVIVCMLVCAVDGKISFKEKRWIKKLIE